MIFSLLHSPCRRRQRLLDPRCCAKFAAQIFNRSLVVIRCLCLLFFFGCSTLNWMIYESLIEQRISWVLHSLFFTEHLVQLAQRIRWQCEFGFECFSSGVSTFQTTAASLDFLVVKRDSQENRKQVELAFVTANSRLNTSITNFDFPFAVIIAIN